MLPRLVACALLGLGLAVPADAATVAHVPADRLGPGTVVVQDTAGEANVLRVSVDAQGRVLAEDASAPLGAGAGCVQVSSSSVRCPPGVVRMSLGGGDDSAATTGALKLDADAGAGNDRLTGGDGRDRLAGGAGRDVLLGGAHDDVLTGREESSEEVVELDGDVLDGGTGSDLIAFPNLLAGVALDLAAGSARSRSGSVTDRVAGMENARGTPRTDLLAGTAGPNLFLPSEGRDTVLARAGDDEVFGNGTIDAGPGADAIFTTAAASVRCGPGRDALTAFSGAPLIGPDCERFLPLRRVAVLPVPDVDGRRVTFRVFCRPSRLEPGSCRFALEVRRGSGARGIRSVRIAPGRSARVLFVLPGGAARSSEVLTVRAVPRRGRAGLRWRVRVPRTA